MFRAAVPLLVCALAIAGCGGDGEPTPEALAVFDGLVDGTFKPLDHVLDPPATPPSQPPSGAQAVAEGFWFGSAPPYDFSAVVLENGEMWGFYVASGLVHGALFAPQINGTSTTFSGTGFDYNFAANARTAVTLSGNYVARSSIDGQAVLPSRTVAFSGFFDASYDVPARLADAVGNWTVRAVTSTGIVESIVNIDAAGRVSSTNAFCSGFGSVAPRASGKNVFDLTLSFSGLDCQFHGMTVRGIAVVESTAQSFVAAALLPDLSDGFFGIGIR